MAKEIEFKESEWLLPTRDEKGHNAKLVFNVQPYVARQLSIILGEKKFPYKSLSDILRHAVHRHINWLLSIKQDIPSVMGQVEVINTLLYEEQQAAEFRKVFGNITTRVSEHVAKGETLQAAKIILLIQRAIDQMKDGYWKQQYIKELNDRHGDFIKSVKKDPRTKVDLLDLDDSEEE